MPATTYSWTRTNGGDWSTGLDWSGSAVPDGAQAMVSIAAPGSSAGLLVDVGAGEAFSAGGVTLGAGVTLDIAGALTIDGPISGAGVLEIAGGGTLILGAATDHQVAFTGPDAVLMLPSLGFGGVLTGFEQSDTIALPAIGATALTLSGSSLSVLDGGTATTLHFAADYGAASFSLSDAGAAALISETGVTYALEGQVWSTPTLTWSFAETTYAADTSASFSDVVTQSADQAVIEQALADWSAATGLVFVEMPDSPDLAGAADLRIGWGSFTGGQVGEADYAYSGSSFSPDVLVRLQDPATTPLVSQNGQLIYSGTDASLLQVALHEIGHALGLAHTSTEQAVMYPIATAANRMLQASDIAGAQALYAGDLACFAAGTEIATPHGPCAVERLRIGDAVLCHPDRAPRPVTWLGHRRIDCAGHADPDSIRPVRIRAHAFARGRPGRELFLSPDHAVFDGARLIPVKYLIDGEAIAQIEADRVTYWHVELAEHAILLAEGLPTESYLDTGNRAQFAGTGIAGRVRSWDEACAPLCLSGPPVARLRRRLATRRSLVRADGAALFSVQADARRQSYLLPHGVQELGLIRPEAVRAVLLDGKLRPVAATFAPRAARLLELLLAG